MWERGLRHGRQYKRQVGILAVLAVCVTAALSGVTTVSAAGPSTVCAPVPTPNTASYWTPFGDSQWTASGLLTQSRSVPSNPYGVSCGGASVYGSSLPTTNSNRITALAFDFNPSLSGASGDSPRLVVCFSDGSNCSSNGSVAPTQWQAGTWTHFDGLVQTGWSSTGGKCGNVYNQTWTAMIACHSGAGISQVAVVNDSGSLYGSGETVLLNNLTVNNVVAHATAPVLGKRATVAPTSGAVRVKRPGAHRFRTVKTVTSLPYGSLVDALGGHLQVIAAKPGGGTQSGQFYGGSFQMTQSGTGYVQASLANHAAGCASDHAATTARARSFSLWGHVKGHYRTRGAYGSASVRGTIWFTQNRCDGTYFHVVEGKLWIRDFTRHRSVVLTAGHSYLAPSALPRHTDHDGDHDGD